MSARKEIPRLIAAAVPRAGCVGGTIGTGKGRLENQNVPLFQQVGSQCQSLFFPNLDLPFPTPQVPLEISPSLGPPQTAS